MTADALDDPRPTHVVARFFSRPDRGERRAAAAPRDPVESPGEGVA